MLRRQKRDTQTSAHTSGDASVVTVPTNRGGQMRDILGNGMLAAHGTGIDGIRFAGFGEGVVARVEVLALFEVLGEMVGSGGEFAVEAEEAGFLWGEGLGGFRC
jgi:hypothetical protein